MFYVESQPGSFLEGAFPTVDVAIAYARELREKLGLHTQVVGDLRVGREGKAYREILLNTTDA